MNFDQTFRRAYGEPQVTGAFRSENADFIVREQLGWAPAGEGEHLLLHIEKDGENTQFVARRLARFFGVRGQAVGFCGLKDRHAITSQWFSVHLPGKVADCDWQGLCDLGEGKKMQARLLEATRHNKKLRRGDHASNRFRIRLRDIPYDESLENKLQLIQKGVPNYFGEQRFGRDGDNLRAAADWVNGDSRLGRGDQRGRIISAARSYLFNRVLDARIARGCWLEPIDGDLPQGPTGPLWGRGRSAVSGQVAELEQCALAEYSHWCDKLEHCGLAQERRPLVLMPEELTWQWRDNTLELDFVLGAGEFATAVLREICRLDNKVQTRTFTDAQ